VNLRRAGVAALFLLAAAFARGQDSGRVAFASDRSGSYEIYVMNADGSNAQPATDFKLLRPGDPWAEGRAFDVEPAWSPDGKRLAFASFSPDSPRHMLFVANADGSGARAVLISTGEARAPRWSSDGQWLTFSGGVDAPGPHVYALQLKTLRWIRITRTPDEDGRDAPLGGSRPDFSPNMQKLAFGCGGAICVTGLDGAHPRALTKKGGGDDSPRWSPDGARLVFTRAGAIWVVNADGTNPHAIRGPKSAGAVWSSVGRRILYSHSRGGVALPRTNGRHPIADAPDLPESLYISNPDGSQAVTISDGTSVDRDPDWTQ
jgi:Tol biopolymer transport system component